MGENSTVPRHVFNTIVTQCLAILARHGFTPRYMPSDTQFRDVFEQHAFVGWFGEVTPTQRQMAGWPVETDLTPRQLDQITLECALAFGRAGMQGVRYNESLNCIRSTIADVLETMGYQKPPLHYQRWGCYKRSEELYRLDGRSEEEINTSRAWWKERFSQFYEETY